jgi:2-dehydropantoate 2-reductase
MGINIGIIGVGGVGGYFGGKLCKLTSAPGVKVYFVARGRHLDEIRTNGLQVSTATEGDWICNPTLATDRIEDLPTLDVCLVCVKSYDLGNVIRQLQSKVSETTAVVPLLNGVDIYERIREDLLTAAVFPACVYIGTHIETYGKVVQKGGACKIIFGKDPRNHSAVPQLLFDLFDKSGIRYEWSGDVSPLIWTKYVFIAAFGLVTAGFDKTLGQVMESRRLSDYVLSAMREIVTIARGKGIDLPEAIVTESYQKGLDFPYETKTSFQRDFECAGKPDERDLFGATILHLGKQLGVGTPVTQELWEILNRRKPLP